MLSKKWLLISTFLAFWVKALKNTIFYNKIILMLCILVYLILTCLSQCSAYVKIQWINFFIDFVFILFIDLLCMLLKLYIKQFFFQLLLIALSSFFLSTWYKINTFLKLDTLCREEMIRVIDLKHLTLPWKQKQTW